MKKTILVFFFFATCVFSSVVLTASAADIEAIDTTRERLLTAFIATRNELGFDDREIDLTIHAGASRLGPLGIRVISSKNTITVSVHDEFIRTFNDREKRALFGYLLIASIRGIGFLDVIGIEAVNALLWAILFKVIAPKTNLVVKVLVARAALPRYYCYLRRNLFVDTAKLLKNRNDMISWMKKVEAKALGRPHRDYHGFTLIKLLITINSLPLLLFSPRWFSDDVYYPDLVKHLRNFR